MEDLGGDVEKREDGGDGDNMVEEVLGGEEERGKWFEG